VEMGMRMGQKESKEESEIFQLAQNSRFTISQLRQIRVQFQSFDKDRSKDLDYQEFQSIFGSSLKREERQLKEIFEIFDTNRNQRIDFAEYVTALSIIAYGFPEEKLKFLFEIFDLDDDDKLSAAEVRTIVSQMKDTARLLGVERDCEDIVRDLDESKDGVITLKEWVEMGMRSELAEFVQMDAVFNK